MKTANKLIAILCVLFVCVSMFTPMANAADPYPLPVLSEKAHSKYCLDAVMDLQAMLNYVNKAGLTVDGYFGPKTKQAVKDFQSKYKLSVTGTTTKATWNKLISLIPTLRENSSKNPKSMVKLLQQILKRNGYNCGQVDGIFGPNTKKAVKVFQFDCMDPDDITGKVNSKTWKALIYIDHSDL